MKETHLSDLIIELVRLLGQYGDLPVYQYPDAEHKVPPNPKHKKGDVDIGERPRISLFN